MSLIAPFSGLRPAPGRAAEVIAPPYDVLSAAEARVRAIEGALPGRQIEIFGYTPDGKLVLAYAVSRNHPGAYYLVDFSTNRAELVGQEYPQLAKVPLG